MRFRHPSKDTLREWLNGEADADVELHLSTCQRCANQMETLDAASEAAIGDALAEVLAPPEGLADRLEAGVAARLSSRQVIKVVADLFGAGFETSRLLLIEEPDDND